MKKIAENIRWVLMIALGCAIFALGFDLFLEPNGLSAGGISGIALIVIHLAPITTVGIATALMNFPLFFFGGKKIGLRFFVGSIIGTVFFSFFIDLFAGLPVPETEPLVAAVYGGVICGAGLGLVFIQNASTGGSDIVIRLLKMKYRNLPIGTISLAFDFFVCAATGIVFGNVSNMLYSLIAGFATSKLLDAVATGSTSPGWPTSSARSISASPIPSTMTCGEALPTSMPRATTPAMTRRSSSAP